MMDTDISLQLKDIPLQIIQTELRKHILHCASRSFFIFEGQTCDVTKTHYHIDLHTADMDWNVFAYTT